MVRPTHHSHGEVRPQDQTGGAALAGFDRHSVVGAEKGASDGRSETTDLVMGVPEPVEPVDIAGCYRAERVNLVRLAYLLSGSKEEAEDAVQSVFADAHGRWGEIGNHGAYLRRAVVNRVRESQRRTFSSIDSRPWIRRAEPPRSIGTCSQRIPTSCCSPALRATASA